MKRYLPILVFAAALLAPAAHADPGNSQGNSQGKGQRRSRSRRANPRARGSRDRTTTRVTGSPATRARTTTGRSCPSATTAPTIAMLKGKERQDFVDWCTDSSERHGFYDWRWNEDRSCYQKADNKGLSGDQRRDFIRRCVDKNTVRLLRRSRQGERQRQGLQEGLAEDRNALVAHGKCVTGRPPQHGRLAQVAIGARPHLRADR